MSERQRKINLAELRAKAESAVAEARQALAAKDAIAGRNVDQLVQELQIYQTELELQNEELVRSQAAEAQAGARYRSLFNGMPLPAALCDATGLIVEANRAALDFLGLRPASLNQRYSFAQFVDAEHRREVSNAVRQNPGAILSPRTVRVKNVRGEIVECELRVMPIAQGDGEQAVSMAILLDKSQESELRRLDEQLREYEARLDGMLAERTRMLEDSETLYHTVAHFTYDWETWIDAEGRMIYSSPSCARITGYDAEEFIADPGLLLRITHPADQRLVHEHFSDHQQSAPPTEIVFRIVRKDGVEAWLEHGCRPIVGTNGVLLGRRGSTRDVTARMHDQETLQLRAEALEKAKSAAEGANRAKSAFLANMSHELRTPLHAIIGMVTLAQRRMTDSKGLVHLQTAKSSADHLLELINDVLDISKIEADRLVLTQTEFCLDDLMESVGAAVRPRADAKGLAYDVRIPPQLAGLPLHADELRLKQVLINLAGNAVKFSERGRIEIRIDVAERSGTDITLRFEVADQGIGIPPESRARLFLPFVQADETLTRRYGGTGLGLAISKRLVEAMGGEIGMHENGEAGSVFWFTVRLSRASAASTKEPRTSGTRAADTGTHRYTSLRALVVEDEPLSQEILRSQLETGGFTVDVVDDGQGAVDAAKAQSYDIVFMDLQMPRMNGLDATRQIRSLPNHRTTPIIATTANAFHDDEVACLDAGMNLHLAKPILAETLFQAIGKVLSKAGRHRPPQAEAQE